MLNQRFFRFKSAEQIQETSFPEAGASIGFASLSEEEDTLDRGELTSMILYKLLQADYLLIDEKIGRKIAKANQIVVVGSLAVLVVAKQKNIITELKPTIEILRQSSIHFSTTLLDQVLESVKEL